MELVTLQTLDKIKMRPSKSSYFYKTKSIQLEKEEKVKVYFNIIILLLSYTIYGYKYLLMLGLLGLSYKFDISKQVRPTAYHRARTS